MMKNLVVVLCTAVMLAFAGSVLANDHKVSICHNGSTYDEATGIETPVSFVITIAGRQIVRAVEKHVLNHGDLETYQEDGDGEVCDLLDDATTECETVTLCSSAETS
jgi:hypothetical protein